MARKKPFDVGMATGLIAANARVAESLATARRLLEAEFPSAAFVWAVRSVEIFVREFLVAPAFFDGGRYEEWMQALRKARKTLGKNNWKKARAVVEKEWGPVDAWLTDSGDDVWQQWIDNAVVVRNDVVHGNGDVTRDSALAAIEYAEQLVPALRRQMPQTNKHPAGDLLLTQLKAAVRMGETKEAEDDST